MEDTFWQEWKKIENWLVWNGYCDWGGTLTNGGRNMLRNIPTACTDWIELYRYYDIQNKHYSGGDESRLKGVAVWMPHRFQGGGGDWWEYRYHVIGNPGDLELEDLEKYRELFGIPREDRFDPLDEMDIL